MKFRTIGSACGAYKSCHNHLTCGTDLKYGASIRKTDPNTGGGADIDHIVTISTVTQKNVN